MTENLVAGMGCLFGMIQGASCSSDASGIPVYFSLGEAIGAFGLIFAVYQLRRPSWDMVLNIRPPWQRHLVWYLSGLGLTAVALAAISTQSPRAWLRPPFNVPLAFELCGFIFFVAAPLSLLILGTRKVRLYRTESCERFYQQLTREISRARPETLDAVIDVVGSNLAEICSTLRVPNVSKAKQESKRANVAMYSNAVFDAIVGDARVANQIATARLDFLFFLVREIKQHQLHRSDFDIGLSSLFRSLFDNPRSFLYSQLERGGLALSANPYEALFADMQLVNSLLPFSNWNTWSLYSRKRDPKYLSIYLMALEKATESYWRQPELQYGPVGVVDGFRQLQGYMRSVSMRAPRKPFDTNVLLELSLFLGHTVRWAFYKVSEEKLISQGELDATRQGHIAITVSSAYAESLYRFFEMLGALEVSEDTLRAFAITSSEHIFGLNAVAGDVFEGIRKIFYGLLWEKIEQNADGLYPAVLPILILTVGMRIGEPASEHGQQRQRLIHFLETRIRPKLLAGAKMADKRPMEKVLLSTHVEFNRATGNFEYVTRGGREPMESA
jgi:hypothetical protein